MAIKLAELAIRHGCELRGDPDLEVSCVATLQAAAPGAISFLANKAYHRYLAETRSTAVILSEQDADDCPVACLINPNPYAAYAAIAAELYPVADLNPGLHSSVVCGVDCVVSDSAELAAGVVLGRNVHVGDWVSIGPNSVIGDDVVIGAKTRLEANVTIYSNVRMGERCIIHSGVVIGADGFGIAQTETGWRKVPQVGGVRIGHDVELGANTTVDRGAVEHTRLGNDVRIDNQCQIGHNVSIGDHTVMAGQAGVAGSTTIGARCMLGGKAAIGGHLTLADDVYIHGTSGISKNIDVPGAYSSALPAEEAGKWRRILARLKRIDSMAKKINNIESILKKIDK